MTSHPTLTSMAIFLCLLAACLCCVIGVKQRSIYIVLPTAFLMTVGALPEVLSLQHIGGAIIAVAMGCLIWRDNPYVRLSCAGLFAGLAVNVFSGHGVNMVGASMIALGLPVLVCLLSLKTGRDQGHLSKSEIGLALIVITAFTVWAGPGVIDGWYTARALNISFSETESGANVPVWAFIFLGLMFMAGIIKGVVFKK